ncbi:MAG: hypothetical protein WBW41_10975 [Verrucomicrobiia bacterium]
MKKFIHALILAVFSYGCLVTWAILSFASHVSVTGHIKTSQSGSNQNRPL